PDRAGGRPPPGARRARLRGARRPLPGPGRATRRHAAARRGGGRGEAEARRMRDEAEHKGESKAVGLGARRCRDAEGVSFEKLIEQTEAKRLLQAALAENPAHAYLFHGPAGVGKRVAALAFAGELLGDPDRVERRAHPDLYV